MMWRDDQGSVEAPEREPRAHDGWRALPPKYLPFADAASAQLPLGRLLRLSLFQVTVGMAMVLLSGTLNRVMIVELGVSTWFVSLLIALPLLFAPARALIGHKSDTHRSILGWRRTPYLWFGTLLQFGGFAIMPFALLLLSGDSQGGAPDWVGPAAAGLAFLMVGAGMHTVQTAGLALASDLAPEASRPRVVALLYVMLLAGMAGAALIYGALLADFSQLRLIQLVQGAGAATLILNLIGLWKQEVRRPELTSEEAPRVGFRTAWRDLAGDPGAVRLLLAVGLGTAAFSMQDVLLEPFGGEILGLDVAATTRLTALLAGGALVGLALSARLLGRGADPARVAAYGALAGVPGFSAVVFAAPVASTPLYAGGAAIIGFGGGLFAVGALTATMALAARAGGGRSGLVLGAWGAVQATAAGLAIALGGAARDALRPVAAADPAFAYSVVYHVEILLLALTLIALGPLTRRAAPGADRTRPFGLAQFPA